MFGYAAAEFVTVPEELAARPGNAAPLGRPSLTQLTSLEDFCNGSSLQVEQACQLGFSSEYLEVLENRNSAGARGGDYRFSVSGLLIRSWTLVGMLIGKTDLGTLRQRTKT
jgi:hypothetical protein